MQQVKALKEFLICNFTIVKRKAKKSLDFMAFAALYPAFWSFIILFPALCYNKFPGVFHTAMPENMALTMLCIVEQDLAIL